MRKVIVIILVALVVLSVTSCFYRVDSIKESAEARFDALGFDIAGYEGTQSGIMGGKVWYVVKRSDSSTLYHACLSYMLSGDLGLYNLEVIDGTRVKIEGK
jgi:hypothetical protein